MDAATLAITFTSITSLFSLPSGLLSAVCVVESGHNIRAINHFDGKTHSFGICQIKLETAKDLGFRGTPKDLMQPEINAHYAGMYLKKQLLRYDNNVPKAVAAYNSGSLLLNDKGQIKNRKYVWKVFTAWGAGQ